MPYLAKIVLYPIKSLDGVEVENVTVLPSGALKGDREFALFDEDGNVVNGKRHAKIHLLRTEFSLAQRTLSLQVPGSDSPRIFHLDRERQHLEATFSDFFGFAVTLGQNLEMGFPDDRNCPGPTVVSTATLTEVASWFPDMTVAQMRRRLRANIEIGGVPAFWEDRLFSHQSDATVSFRIGDICFLGIQPCQRCVVPTRHPDSGKADSNFQKIFVQQRQATLPDWAAASRFNHFYKLTVNTQLSAPSVGKILQVGNEVAINT
ncbi:MOSC N-terminal beta barrel domain-containing protein [Tolypothrix sp. FACHB-123]|uniref:MOSC domain-containing protein n=1 Tax=Tolypothrix sp. FACHB-123 TaxID=2692868 RepID=UPI001688CA57|nr:MOSC N-terminal beta barrel domain-containing protein [Tolypothrix sp. FACHB-123]MBD2353046.1 MOSC N-terminal beta barrel domain-containing protein [Tolypothrix sp. FACHB-123]